MSNKYRDVELEERARSLINPLSPKLASQIIVGWNSRMSTTAGVAIAARSEVWLNPSLRAISDKEIERTLLHELAHLLAHYRHSFRRYPRIQPHGIEWREACSDLGIAGEPRTHQLPFKARRMNRRYRLRCPACGESHERVRAPKRRIACLRCCRLHHGGRYHERFRLEILKIGSN
jgi:predicted SprT family Zn-dependent metalloprotease